MTKKSLGDLLREEAHKSLESEEVGTTERSQELVQKSSNNSNQAAEQTIDVTATARPVDADESPTSTPEPSAAETSETKKRGLSPKTSAKAADPKATEAKTMKSSSKTDNAQPESSDHTTLEATIAELKSGLATAQKTESTLQEKLTALQAELDEQKSLAQKLQAEQKQTQKLKAELEDAKQTILKLTEAGSQAAQPEPPKPAKPEKPEKPEKSSGLQLAKQPESQHRDYRSHRILLSERIPQHSMHQHYPSKTTSDSDLGWFD